MCLESLNDSVSAPIFWAMVSRLLLILGCVAATGLNSARGQVPDG